MRRNFIFTVVVAAISSIAPLNRADGASGTEASLKVYSVQFSRNSPDFNRRFPNRYGYQNEAGTTLQLLLTINDGTLLPLDRDAVSVDTFVDDTYQNLMNSGDPNRPVPYGQSGQSSISEDGHSIIFTVAGRRSPAEDAGRIFVRGSIQARISQGEALVVSNQMPLVVGQGVTVGPFRTVVRSVSDSDGNLGGALSVTVAVDGEAWRIQKARVLDSNGKVLSDHNMFRLGTGERGSTAYITLRSAPKDPVTIEYTYLEKVESVRIPFEAQVDVGVAKAGPIEPGEGKSPRKTGARVWPPPRENPEFDLPPRRAAFDPAAKMAGRTPPPPMKPDKASVDLFSLTVAKPAPGEVKGVTWKNPPSPSFYPSGFTMARLLLTVPGGSILSVPPEGITVNRFEDDKGGKLDTTLYREADSSFSSPYYAWRSPDEQQTLLNVSLASAPTPGATRCTLTGQVEAKVARGEITNSSPKLEFKRGQSFTAGPFTVKIDMVRQVPAITPSNPDNSQIEAWLSIAGPNDQIRSLELLDESGNPITMRRVDAPGLRSEYGTLGLERESTRNRSFRLSSAPSGPVSLRVRSYGSTELVKIPFELSTGVGL